MAVFLTRVQAVILCALLLLKLGEGTISLQVRSKRRQEQAGTKIAVRHGVLFQTNGCPWAISESEMSRKSNYPPSGNTINMTTQCIGRAGNHFVNLSQFLAMGYCCKSKLVELPREDKTFTGPNGGIFNSDNRFFDFSTVDVMPLEEYHTLSKLPHVCWPNRNVGLQDGYKLVGIHQDLLSCMNRIYLRGCEEAYLGEMVKTEEFCPARETHLQSTPLSLHSSKKAADARSLAVHIRSGDIFYVRGDRSRYGQPPVQFYVDTITNKPWSEVSIMTHSEVATNINPAYTALQELNAKGVLGPNVNFHLNRPFATDMEAMLCADGLVFARSSLAMMTSAHGRATYFYVPLECGPGSYTRERRTWRSAKVVQDNTTLLVIEKPDAEVYGIEWASGREAYTVYIDFQNTPRQRTEMVEYDGIKGLTQCRI